MSLFKKFQAFIKDLFSRIPSEVREWASRSLQVTAAIKSALESPVADIITAIIPGTWDDQIKTTVLQALHEALPYLQIVDECKDKETTEEMVLCWLRALQRQPKHVQNALLHKLSALLTALMHNKELKQSEYDYYLQLMYSGNKELKN